MVNWNNISEGFSDLFRDLYKLQDGKIGHEDLKDSIDKLEAILMREIESDDPFRKLWLLLG